MKFKIKYASDSSYERIADINTIEELENLPERTQELPESKGYAWELRPGERYSIRIEFECTVTNMIESTQVFNDTISRGIILEVPDNEPQFKPFDKVLVRNDVNSIWQPSIFTYQIGDSFYTVSLYPYEKEHIIPYEGNEYLVGTTDNPK